MLLARARRVEQERVVANDATGGPVNLDDQIEIRIVDCLLCRHFQLRRTVGGLHDGDAGAGKCHRKLHVVVAIDRLVCNLRRKRIQFFFLRRGQLDVCREWLAETRVHRELAQAEGKCRGGQREDSRQQAPNDQGFCSHADLRT